MAKRIYDKKCLVDICERDSYVKGYCPKHHYRYKVYGDPFMVRYPWREDRSCMMKECTEEHEAKGLCRRHYLIIKKFNISIEDYAKKMIEQNGKCKICNKEEKQNKVLSLDHDHETGIVRDLLCSSCNLALGGFMDNPILLTNAINYLKKWGKS